MSDPDLETRLASWIERHVLNGTEPDILEACADRPELAGPLGLLVDEYRRVSDLLDGARLATDAPVAARDDAALPVFDGFRTIERLGTGGVGEVYKLHDLTLNRTVAAKVLRGDSSVPTSLAGFLKEARALALFRDPRIVQIFEFRNCATPPVLIMEYIDGFELGRVARSLEFHQRARIAKDVCEAVQHAHELGVQHRDLKPSNIMLDAALHPRILDFGLSGTRPDVGHFLGTPRYLAPEQLDPAAPIDARTDVYGLGAVLYEVLCGAPPVDGCDVQEIVERVARGEIRLPVEIDSSVPEPLQAIALKALERRPADRYATARDMAEDLGRYLDGRTVSARPSHYMSALTARVRPHLAQIEDWQRLKLVYPHEAAALRGAYRQLDRRDDDWIGESRLLSYSQIALYMGAFLLLCGSLFYFGAHRIYESVQGVFKPFIVLGLPFLGLNTAAHHLARRDHRAVSVAFYLGGVSVLPLFLLIVFHETGLWVVGPNVAGQLFADGSVSNHQVQVTVLVATVWTAWLALRTRTVALSTVCTALVFLFTLAVLGDRGLRSWLEESRWDLLALHLLPLVAVYAAAGRLLERSARAWFGRPLWSAAGALLVAVLELLALDGRMFHYLGLSMVGLQPEGVSDRLLLDSLAAMSLNGLVFYAVAAAADRYGTDIMKPAAWLLFTVSPFAVLEPLAYLSRTGEYSTVFDWLYLALAVAASLVSHQRQRRSFYYAGLLNTGVALYLIADHRHWLDRPAWAILLVIAGLAGLAAGFLLDARDRRVAGPQSRAS